MAKEFIEKYFAKLKEVNDFHLSMIDGYGFKRPRINYILLKRFIDNAISFLSKIDDKLLNGLLLKMFRDVKSLFEYYQQVKEKTKYPEVIFYQEYLENLPEYKELKDEYETQKALLEELNSKIQRYEDQLKRLNKDDEQYRKTNRMYVDALHKYSKIKDEFNNVKNRLKIYEEAQRSKFFSEFEKVRNQELQKLEDILNVKLYYFDKLLWDKAKKSYDIVKFFESANIDGDFSTKTFIKYFLKNIDTTKSKNKEWFDYLKRILRIVE
jgi:DNA repair exonuclease SbcCD ATPase subunit